MGLLAVTYSASTADGQRVQWRDGKRLAWLLSVVYPLVPLVGVALHALTGKPAMLAAPLVIGYGLMPLLDALIGEDRNNPPEAVVPPPNTCPQPCGVPMPNRLTLPEWQAAARAGNPLARQGLAHYFAAAVLLPYPEFLDAAKRSRYDIELLQQHFHVGFETVCHRLSTLQRAGARAVPFYFVRLDQAGNISKRHSATAFHFARHGGACPLWHVHEAFAQPERILTQVAEMPDGMRFFGIARTTGRGGGGFRSRRKLFAIGLGCELAHAHELVYADGIDLERPRDVVPIGPGCRVCPRTDCVQRAFPPAGKALVADSDHESLVSYRFKAD
mgnify:CR=1 FL=1